MNARQPHADLRQAEIIMALSLATDLGTGRPMEWAMRSALLGVRLAEAAARAYGPPESDVQCLRRAALAHDVGKVAVPHGLWNRLCSSEWECVRLHPYYTELAGAGGRDGRPAP